MPCLEHVMFHLEALETLYQFTFCCSHPFHINNGHNLPTVGARAAEILRELTSDVSLRFCFVICLRPQRACFHFPLWTSAQIFLNCMYNNIAGLRWCHYDQLNPHNRVGDLTESTVSIVDQSMQECPLIKLL